MPIKMKQGGVWKDATDEYIKVNGVWQHSVKKLIKVGGHWSDTSDLSATKLDYDMTIAKEADGSRYLVNKVEPNTHKAPLHSGHSVTLSGDGKIDVPINATLGSEEIPSVSKTLDSATNEWMYIDLITPTIFGTKHILEYTISATSLTGGANLQLRRQTGTTLNDKDYVLDSTVGTHTFIVEADQVGSNFTRIAFRALNNGGSGTITIDTQSLKEIEQVQGSVTTFNETTKEFEQVGADGVGSKELVINGDFSDGLNGWIGDNLTNVDTSNNNAHFVNTSGQVTYIKQQLPQKRCLISIESTEISKSYGKLLGFDNHNVYDIFNPLDTIGNYSKIINEPTWVSFRLYRANVNTSFDFTIDNVSVKEALPLSTTYTLKDGTYGLTTKLHTAQFSQADLDAFNARPELMIEWYFGTATIPSAIVFGVDDRCYYNLKDLKVVDTLTITGTNSKKADNQYGVQSLLLKEDANGIPTAIAKAGTIEGSSDGRYVELPLVDATKQKHLVTKCLSEIKGDITQVTEIPCTP